MIHLLRNSLIALTAACALPAAADTVTQWDFNSGTLSPSVGSGTAALAGDTTTATFATTGNDGSGDPAGGSGNLAWNTKTYPPNGSANKTSGVEFRVGTKVGTASFEDITVTFSIRHSSTASRFERFQYSLDGSVFIDLNIFSVTLADTWSQRSVDLSGISGVGNNPSFAFRIVSEFESTATGSGAASYLPSGGASYSTSGTWRFDMVGVSGTRVSPVPEPTTAMLGLVGGGALALRARRRR